MTKDDIIALPHAHLRERSKKVGFISDEIKQLVEDMQKATLEWDDSRDHEITVALAAVQVNRLLRVIIIREDFDGRKKAGYNTFINPEITKYEGDIQEDYEGCLSIKHIYGLVPRYSKVRIKAFNMEGKEVRLTAEGFLARIFQHEIDHTNGKLFIDHIKDSPEAFFALGDDGHLIKLEYDKDVKDNRILWE